MTQLELPFQKTRRIAILDSRPRILGMFSLYPVNDKEKVVEVPIAGMMDHLMMCDCKYSEKTPHPKFHCAAVYVRAFGYILSVSWPTWFPL